MGSGVVSPEKGGALRTTNTAGRRAALAMLFTGVLIAAPLLLLTGQGQASSTPASHRARGVGPRAARSSGIPAAPWRLVLFGRRSTTAPPPPPTTTTTAPPPPPTTTTTAPPPPPTTTTTAPPPAPAGQSATGVATWYGAAPPGRCASPWLPFGTVLEVVNEATGASTSCVVDDREGANPGRIVDLSYDGFSQIADPSQGVVAVTISW